MRIIDKRGIDVVLSSCALAAKRFKELIMRELIRLCPAPVPATSTPPTRTKNHPDKIEIKKYDPVVRKHVTRKKPDQASDPALVMKKPASAGFSACENGEKPAGAG